jgi:holo-[acyl-carrier protein] synthase
MIKGIGTDIVTIARIDRITRERFIERILAEEERAVYQAMTDEKRKKTFLAGRFAAKEALFKALDSIGQANYRDFIILNDEHGKPYVQSKHFAQGDIIHVSIAHTDTHAIAYVLVEST